MKTMIEIEKLADNVCAECLVSKHSLGYRHVVLHIAKFCGINDVVFDRNNIPLKEKK